MGAGASSPHFPVRKELEFLNTWTSDDVDDFSQELAHSTVFFGLTLESFNQIFPGDDEENSKALFEVLCQACRDEKLESVKSQEPRMINSLTALAALTVITYVNDQQSDVDLARALYDLFDFESQGKGLTFDTLSMGLYCTLHGVLAITGRPRSEWPVLPSRESVQVLAAKAFHMFQKVGIECGPSPAPPVSSISYEEFTFWLSHTMAGRPEEDMEDADDIMCDEMDLDEVLGHIQARIASV